MYEQRQSQKDRLKETVVATDKDSYRILQLNREEGLQVYRFESLEKLEELGFRLDEIHYHDVYEGVFMNQATTNERLHALYQQFPGFNSRTNPLRSLEDSVEQNDNNLDGIINNLPPVPEPNPSMEENQFLMLQEQARNEEREQKEKKKSVREKLQQSSRTQVPKKSLELLDGR